MVNSNKPIIYLFLKKVSLSVMAFTYLFAGLAHFTRFDYFLSITPLFIPHPKPLVILTGLMEVCLALFLSLPRSRRWACYGIIVLLSLSLPINVYVLHIGGAGIPLPHWVLVGRIPFQLVLIFWAYWHSKKANLS
jgi:uncharacterized membrane protein